MLDEKSAKRRKQEVREINRLGTTLHAGDPGLILSYHMFPQSIAGSDTPSTQLREAPEYCWMWFSIKLLGASLLT